MADLEKDPKDEAAERSRDREVHRAQLEAVRAAFAAEGQAPTPDAGVPDDAYQTEYLLARLMSDMRRLEHKQRTTARLAAALAVSVVLGAVVFVWQVLPQLDGSTTLDVISARSIRADHVAVTGDLRLLDAAGNELAVLGRDLAAAGAGNAEAPIVLALNAVGDPNRQLLRLAASKTGAAVTLETPTGSSSVSLLSMQSGSSVEVRQGEQTQRFSGGSAGELPSVAAGPKVHGTKLSVVGDPLAWAPLREGPPRGDISEVREIGHGFLVADLSALPVAEGVEVRGRMVNTTAVTHNGLVFRITLGGASSTLTVPKISPGNSTGFKVTVPDARIDHQGDAQVEYLGSTVTFQATSTDPRYGRLAERNR